MPALCDPESIDAACFRKNLTKSGLIRIATTFRRRLEGNKITRIVLSDDFKIEASNSEIYKAIQNRPYNPDGAPHDGFVAYYVKKMRGFSPRCFSDANYWFLTDSKYSNNSCVKPDGTMFERIRADYLMSILWFSAPSLRTNGLSSHGLSKLLHHTLKSATPDSSLLRQFEANIRRYASDEITDDDIIMLGSSNACRSVDKLRTLNELAKESPNNFRIDLFSMVKETKAAYDDKLNQSKHLVETLTSQNISLEESQKHIREESKKQIQSEIDRMSLLLNDLTGFEKAILIKAKSNTKTMAIAVIVIFLLLQFFTVMLSIKLDWNLVERFIWWSNLCPAIFTFIFFAATGKTFNPSQFYKRQEKRDVEKVAKSMNFNLNRIKELTKELQQLKIAFEKM